jgi:hypothetical protein
MAKGLKGKSIGAWIFLIGVLLAVVIGLFPSFSSNSITLAILVIIGLVIGFMNISAGEASKFLLAGAALIIVSSMGQGAIPSGNIGGIITSVLNSLLMLFVPATIIVALRTMFAMAKN